MSGLLTASVLAAAAAAFAVTAWPRRADQRVLLARGTGPGWANRGDRLGRDARTPRPVRVAKVLGIWLSCIAAAASVLTWRPGLLVVAGAVALTLHGPRLLASRRSARRRAAVDRHVLDFVELLVAATQAGLPPAAAIDRAATLMAGPLGEELQTTAGEIALGLGWRAALDRLVARTGAASLARLAVALAQAHRLGTSSRASLRSIAGELRADRRVRAEELARRAPVKMLFPLVFLILPAFLLLTVGPVLLATFRSLR